jgi:hypothetical protein
MSNKGRDESTTVLYREHHRIKLTERTSNRIGGYKEITLINGLA